MLDGPARRRGESYPHNPRYCWPPTSISDGLRRSTRPGRRFDQTKVRPLPLARYSRITPAGHPIGPFQPGFSPDVASITLHNDVWFDCLPTDRMGAGRRGDRRKSSGPLRRARHTRWPAPAHDLRRTRSDPAAGRRLCSRLRARAWHCQNVVAAPINASANPPPRRSPTPTTLTSDGSPPLPRLRSQAVAPARCSLLATRRGRPRSFSIFMRSMRSAALRFQ